MSKSIPLPTNSGYPHPSWIEFIQEEIFSDRHMKLLQRVGESSENIFPPPQERYNALRLPLKMVKVVILGQDPYHKRGQAHGLAFSVKPETPVPPSLKNIYKELEKEGFGKARQRDGYLQPWAEQGVLLLNTVLTVSEGKANSHKGWGWEALTDLVISSISEHQEHVVFMCGEKRRRKSGCWWTKRSI